MWRASQSVSERERKKEKKTTYFCLERVLFRRQLQGCVPGAFRVTIDRIVLLFSVGKTTRQSAEERESICYPSSPFFPLACSLWLMIVEVLQSSSVPCTIREAGRVHISKTNGPKGRTRTQPPLRSPRPPYSLFHATRFLSSGRNISPF